MPSPWLKTRTRSKWWRRTAPSRSFELHVAPEDMGKVIGRQGRIAKAIRTLVKAATVKDEKPVFVEIV